MDGNHETKEQFFDQTLAQRLREAGLANDGQYVEYNNGGVRLDGEFSLEELLIITTALKETHVHQPTGEER